MNPTHDKVIAWTRERFPNLRAVEGIVVEPLEKGGSDRTFLRLRAEGHAPLIFVQYGSLREENRHYVEIGAFLAKQGVRVPQMFLHELEHGRIWMEDLGEIDLWSYRNEPWSVRRPLYEATLEEVLHLHVLAERVPADDVGLLGLQPAFDEKLYLWEQDYFFQNCLIRHFGHPPDTLESVRKALHQIAYRLATYRRVLVHRDFQSQNIMISAGAPCLIDFQGMRFGLAQYDLASLLLDPYVELEESERRHLLRFYLERLKALGIVSDNDFEAVYPLCAAQRLMQALGAYGFLGHEKGRMDFLSHIPKALPRLYHIAVETPELVDLAAILSPLVSP